MAQQTQCREGNYRLLSACCAGALAEFSEPAHIKRDLMGKFDRVLAFRRLDHGCVERSLIITVIGDKSRQQDLAVLGHALCLIGTGPQAIRIIDLDGGDAGHRIK